MVHRIVSLDRSLITIMAAGNLTFIFLLKIAFIICVAEKITYFRVEHPKVTYYNKSMMNYFNMTTRRYGRANPIYYVEFHYDIMLALDHNIQIDIYIYEWLTNVYKRSFVEFHYDWCDFIEKDMFFGAAMRQGKLLKPCPHPPGIYHLVNMTVNPAVIPNGFPFSKGRIYANISVPKIKARMGEGYIDMALTQIDKKKAKF